VEAIEAGVCTNLNTLIVRQKHTDGIQIKSILDMPVVLNANQSYSEYQHTYKVRAQE
jgi:hypothetical protein